MLKETLKQLISTYGVDDVVRELHNQLKDHIQVGSGVWETDDGKNHMAVICINSGDNIEHTIGEFIEKSLGVIVLEPSRDNNDALHKAVMYINSVGFKELPKRYHYNIPTSNNLYGGFDDGIVYAHNVEEARIVAKQEIEEGFNQINKVLSDNNLPCFEYSVDELNITID